MEKYNWSAVLNTKIILPGTVVLFQYGTGLKEDVEICHVVCVNGVMQVLASTSDWARRLDLFTQSGTLIRPDGTVEGRLIRQMEILLPEWVQVNMRS